MHFYCAVCGQGASAGCACEVVVESRPLKRERSPEQLRGIIEWARGEWRDDGAEGETVHALCDALEARLDRERRVDAEKVAMKAALFVWRSLHSRYGVEARKKRRRHRARVQMKGIG